MHASRARELTVKIEGFLSHIGDNAADVANFLRTERAHGLPHHRTECAIAKYLYVVLGGEPAIHGLSVGNDYLSVVGRRWWSATLRIELPLAIKQFIEAFDRYEYPDLISLTPQAGSQTEGQSEIGKP